MESESSLTLLLGGARSGKSKLGAALIEASGWAGRRDRHRRGAR